MFLSLLLFKRSLKYPRFIRVKVDDQSGCAFRKTETRRKAGEADCGSGKALSPTRDKVPLNKSLERILLMIDWLDKVHDYTKKKSSLRFLAHGCTRRH